MNFNTDPSNSPFVIKKIFANYKAVQDDATQNSNSNVSVGDYVLISYGNNYSGNLETDENENWNGTILRKQYNGDHQEYIVISKIEPPTPNFKVALSPTAGNQQITIFGNASTSASLATQLAASFGGVSDSYTSYITGIYSGSFSPITPVNPLMVVRLPKNEAFNFSEVINLTSPSSTIGTFTIGESVTVSDVFTSLGLDSNYTNLKNVAISFPAAERIDKVSIKYQEDGDSQSATASFGSYHDKQPDSISRYHDLNITLPRYFSFPSAASITSYADVGSAPTLGFGYSQPESSPYNLVTVNGTITRGFASEIDISYSTTFQSASAKLIPSGSNLQQIQLSLPQIAFTDSVQLTYGATPAFSVTPTDNPYSYSILATLLPTPTIAFSVDSLLPPHASVSIGTARPASIDANSPTQTFTYPIAFPRAEQFFVNPNGINEFSLAQGSSSSFAHVAGMSQYDWYLNPNNGRLYQQIGPAFSSDNIEMAPYSYYGCLQPPITPVKISAFSSVLNPATNKSEWIAAQPSFFYASASNKYMFEYPSPPAFSIGNFSITTNPESVGAQLGATDSNSYSLNLTLPANTVQVKETIEIETSSIEAVEIPNNSNARFEEKLIYYLKTTTTYDETISSLTPLETLIVNTIHEDTINSYYIYKTTEGNGDIQYSKITANASALFDNVFDINSDTSITEKGYTIKAINEGIKNYSTKIIPITIQPRSNDNSAESALGEGWYIDNENHKITYTIQRGEIMPRCGIEGNIPPLIQLVNGSQFDYSMIEDLDINYSENQYPKLTFTFSQFPNAAMTLNLIDIT